MGNLVKCVHAGIGATAASNPSLVIGYLRQRLFKCTLYSRLLALDLPAQELAAVIFNTNGVAQGLHQVQHLLCFGLLFLATVAGHFLENYAGSFLVTH